MGNPNIGFKVVKIVLGFHDLDYSLRYNFPDKALAAISNMMNSLRGLRRAIRAGKNAVASIGVKGIEDNETNPN